MANEMTKRRIADVLRAVADNVDEYIPESALLEDSTFTVRIQGYEFVPTVELVGTMYAGQVDRRGRE